MRSPAAFKSILFPVDFSEMSALTAVHVRGVAQLTRATVTLIHVVPWLAAWCGTTELRPAVAGDEQLRDLERQQAIALAVFQKKYLRDVPSVQLVESGAVAETITDRATQIGADLIMMPTRGIGRSRPFLIGSTTAKVLHDAQCAVWTSPHLAALGPFTGFRHIVCALDHEHIPAGFVEEAARLASCFDSKLTFVIARPSMDPDGRVEAFRDEFSQAHGHQLPHTLDWSLLTESGSVGVGIRRVVEKQGADLVLANRGHLPHRFGQFRTHTYEIVLESPCPVLSLYLLAPTESEEVAYATSRA